MKNKLTLELLHSALEEDTLQHHGIIGMKWGVRRFQPYAKGYSGDGKYIGTDKKPSGQVDEKRAEENNKSFASAAKSAKNTVYITMCQKDADGKTVSDNKVYDRVWESKKQMEDLLRKNKADTLMLDRSGRIDKKNVDKQLIPYLKSQHRAFENRLKSESKKTIQAEMDAWKKVSEKQLEKMGIPVSDKNVNLLTLYRIARSESYIFNKYVSAVHPEHNKSEASFMNYIKTLLPNE